MSNQNLIDSLVKDLKPVKVIKLNWKYYLKFLVVAFFCVLAAYALSGLRFDIQEVIFTPRFIFETIILILLSILSVLSAFQLSIPGDEKSYTLKLPLFVFVLWISFLIYLLLRSDQPVAGWGFMCATESLTVSILPGLFLFFIVQKAAPLKTRWILLFITLAGGALGLLSSQFSCSKSDPLHVLVWHGLPIIILAGIGYFLNRLFRKRG